MILSRDLLIDNWQVVGSVKNPDGFDLFDPVKLSFFDVDKFPYVLARDDP